MKFRNRNPKPSDEEYRYTWEGLARPAGRRGQPCKIVSRKGNVPGVILIEFKDNTQWRVVASKVVKR